MYVIEVFIIPIDMSMLISYNILTQNEKTRDILNVAYHWDEEKDKHLVFVISVWRLVSLITGANEGGVWVCAYGEVVLMQGKSDLCNKVGGGQETGKPEWLLSYASRNSVVIHYIHYREFWCWAEIITYDIILES